VERQVIEDFLHLWGFVAFIHGAAGRLLVHRDFDATKLEPGSRDFGRYFTRDVSRALVGMARLRGFTKSWGKVMQRFDVMLSPTLAEPPPVLGHLKTDQPFELVFGRLISYTPFTGAMNAAGAPALSLPLGRSQHGLPMGVQFAAAHGRDALLLELGLSIEEARPWPRLAPRSGWSDFKA
jgi:amidase